MRRRTVLHGQAAEELLLAAGLQAMGDAILDEIGPGITFALFVDWRDGKPLSYMANAERSSIVKELATWLAETQDQPGRAAGLDGRPIGDMPELEAKCAAVGRSMVEEDIDVVLFLFRNGAAEDGGGVAWFTSMKNARQVVDDWTKTERNRS